jgi:hypothetical protein
MQIAQQRGCAFGRFNLRLLHLPAFGCYRKASLK